MFEILNIKEFNNGSDYLISSYDGKYFIGCDFALDKTNVHIQYKRRIKINSIFKINGKNEH